MSRHVHVHLHRAATADTWKESLHPRNDDGKFGTATAAAKTESPDDYMDLLFGGPQDPAEVAAGLKAMQEAEKKRLVDEATARKVEADKEAKIKAANRCPKCAGSGRLPQFAHRQGGSCFTCGGSGVFTRILKGD